MTMENACGSQWRIRVLAWEEERLKQIRAALNDGTEMGSALVWEIFTAMYEDGEMHIYSHKGCMKMGKAYLQ